MAITSTSQILNLSSVQNAVNELDTAISFLRSAKNSLVTSKGFCGTDALETNEGNTFPEKIKSLCDNIDTQITALTSLKSGVMERARRINSSETYQYNQYLKQKAEEEAAAAAAAQANS